MEAKGDLKKVLVATTVLTAARILMRPEGPALPLNQTTSIRSKIALPPA